jgi:predicted GH43/DUF377 family glycosyl hydrolase
MGMVPNVVFPTGLDQRPDGTCDLYYGMADTRIGVARVVVRNLLAMARAQRPMRELLALEQERAAS